jgi:DNA-binding MarR family transcriptional regulator
VTAPRPAPRPAPPPAADAVPLARLLAMAFRDLIDGLHARLAELGWTDIRPAYGFVLLAARDAPITGADVARLLGVTKQAAAKLVDAMERAGYLRRTPSPDDARAMTLRLTERGHELLATVERVYAELEAGWAAHVGARRLAQIRGGLHDILLAEHDGGLPPVRPTW